MCSSDLNSRHPLTPFPSLTATQETARRGSSPRSAMPSLLRPGSPSPLKIASGRLPAPSLPRLTGGQIEGFSSSPRHARAPGRLHLPGRCPRHGRLHLLRSDPSADVAPPPPPLPPPPQGSGRRTHTSGSCSGGGHVWMPLSLSPPLRYAFSISFSNVSAHGHLCALQAGGQAANKRLNTKLLAVVLPKIKP